MAPTTAPFFRPALFQFLGELAQNNEREWFIANKGRYEDSLRGPSLEFIAAVAPLFVKVSPYIRCDPRPVGGSLFRINRDVRFSKDKSPYKTHAGIHLRHDAAKNAHAPGFYLHLEPKTMFVGMGLWRPDATTARRIRETIVDDPGGWKRATRGKTFREAFELRGESLKRPPRGFDPDHEMIEDLMRKDFTAIHDLTRKDVCARGFERDFVALCKKGAPMMRFLCGALELPF